MILEYFDISSSVYLSENLKGFQLVPADDIYLLY
jgi:hypothetical protein